MKRMLFLILFFVSSVAYSQGNVYNLRDSTSILGSLRISGNLTLAGTVWGTIPIMMDTTATSAPDWQNFQSGKSLAYDGTVDETASFRAYIPSDYKEGSDITFYVHWSPEDNSGGNVKWELNYSWANVGTAFPAQTPLTITVAAGTTTALHNRDGFSAITGTGFKIGSVVLGSFTRRGADAADTYNSLDAYLHRLVLHYERDTMGSRTITAK